MRNTDNLKESEQKDGSGSRKTYHVKNLRLHVAVCIAAAAVGIFAAVVGITNLNAEKTSAEEQEEPAISYTYTDMNSTMYATSPVRIRNLPSTDGDTIASLSTNQEVTVTGQCNETGWYRIDLGGGSGYVNYKFLSDIKVEVHE